MNNEGFSVFQHAMAMAARAHQGHNIRSSRVPYISHPVRVAVAVMNVFGCSDEKVAAAALLHDTLEKTTLRPREIEDAFGPVVLSLVYSLTKEKGIAKEAYWKRLAEDVWQARLIKMADALDHLDCPPSEMPKRIKSGKRALLLAFSNEAPIRKAKLSLERALAQASMKLEDTDFP